MAFVDEAKSFLMEAGYPASLLCPEYRFTWRNGKGDLANDTLPLVAFGAPPFTMRTACVSIFTALSDPERTERLQQLRFLTSPLAIVNTGATVELWAIRRDAEPAKLGRADSKQWQVGLRSRIQDLSPEPLLRSKSGGFQLDFVDAGLIEWAERITEQTLTALIEDVLRAALSQKLSTGSESFRPKNQSFRQSVLRLVFHLFACRVLEDKGVIELHETPEASLGAARDRFSENIDPNILLSADLNPTLISTVFEQLRTRFAFASLTTEMLGHVYENALVTPELRRENGIYYLNPAHSGG